VAIVTGQTLSTDLGKGAGVFVEYAGAGQWHVWTSCDSLLVSGSQCRYDLFFTPESGSTIAGAKLDPSVGSVSSTSTSAEAHVITTTGSNAVDLVLSTPGSGLMIEARIDGDPDPHIFYWAGPEGAGVIHQGAPTNPALFVPTAP
jgi:hypothetical protein